MGIPIWFSNSSGMNCLNRKSIFTFRVTIIAQRKGDSGPYYLVSGAGGAHYRDREDIKDFSTSNAESLFVHRDTGFLWMEIHEASATFRFYDKAGDLLYEKQHEQQD